MPTRAQLLGARVDLACLRIAERLLPPRAPRRTARRRPGGRGRRATWPPPWPDGCTRLPGGCWARAGERWPGPTSTSCSPPTAAGPRRSGPRACCCPPGPATASPTRSCPSGSRAATWTSLRPWTRCSATGRRRPPSPSPSRGPPRSRTAARTGGAARAATPSPPPRPAAQAPRPARAEPRPLPYHRIGPVREALLRLAEDDQPPGALDPWLSRLVLRLDGPEPAGPGSDAHWWSSNLLTSVLLRLPDARPHLPLLRALAERMAHRAADSGEQPLPAGFWTELPLPVPELVGLLRLLVRGTDPEPQAAVARLIRCDPAAALPALCEWFRDERTAATALQLLRTHRRIALDDLTEALVDAAHPRADALLRELAATEPSALCRAVDRWVHDPRPERHVAAAVHGPAVLAESPADRRLLCFAAQALLARETEGDLHGAALALLVADPGNRARHLPAPPPAMPPGIRCCARTIWRGPWTPTRTRCSPPSPGGWSSRGRRPRRSCWSWAPPRPRAPSPPPPGWSATTWSAARRPPRRSRPGWTPAAGSSPVSGRSCWPSPAGSPTAGPPPSGPSSSPPSAARRRPIRRRSAANCWRCCGQPSRCGSLSRRMAGYREQPTTYG
ncbi:hypothetical protein GXW82_40180 [Streptacidiphilus sp. 4-A2]|nr:hypothetical protein [Streptacidiphilus sp. 4-A2]